MNIPMIGVKYAFVKQASSGSSEVSFTRYPDGSAYIDGAEEIGFEDVDNAWELAIEYLVGLGYGCSALETGPGGVSRPRPSA